jgi:hypothetical protein
LASLPEEKVEEKEEKKSNRLWEVDPTIFQPGKPAGYFEKLISLLRAFGKYVSFALLLFYGPILVILGIAFGGLVFWGALAGSMALIGLILKKLGYAKNFAAWNPSIGRQLLSLFLGFLLAVGLYLGLFTFQIWLIPIAFGLAALGVFLALRKRS